MLLCTSPRLSFSDDLGQDDRSPLINEQEQEQLARRDASLMEPGSDFEFRISGSSDQESSSADELFKNGRIVPARIRSSSIQSDSTLLQKQRSSSLPPPRTDNILIRDANEVNPSPGSKSRRANSFWGFNRSSSVHNETKKSQLFDAASLYRSHSTGSVLTASAREYQKRGTSRHRHSTSSSPSSTAYVYSVPQQKSSWRKNCGAQGNGFWVSPVLNVPTPCIAKGTATLLSLGSRLRGSKEKRSRK